MGIVVLKAPQKLLLFSLNKAIQYFLLLWIYFFISKNEPRNLLLLPIATL